MDEKDNEVDAAVTGMNVVVETSAGEASTEIVKTTIGANMNSKSVFLLIVPITVHIGKKSFDTYALLDDGSQSTMVRNSFFQKFGVPRKNKEVYKTTIKDKAEHPVTVKELSLDVSARDGSNRPQDQNSLRATNGHV